MMVTFETAIEQTKGEDRALLTGNGFSIAQTRGSFSYANLLEESDLSCDSPIRRLFTTLSTVDFEQIIKSVEHARLVADTYGYGSLSRTLAEDAEKVRGALITAIQKVHPESYAAIEMKELGSCAAFLEEFEEVYTLNYDLLLYWVNIHGQIFADGFGLGEKNGNFQGPFNEQGHCHIYNVHGGLHLFLTDKREVEKLVARSGNLLDEIGQEIQRNKRLPIFVAEGSTEEKLNKVRSIPYLDYCYKKLSYLRGSLFVVGHSADERDSHIYDALFSSNLSSIYFCVHDPSKNLELIRERLAPFRARNNAILVKFVDGSTVNIWDK